MIFVLGLSEVSASLQLFLISVACFMESVKNYSDVCSLYSDV